MMNASKLNSEVIYCDLASNMTFVYKYSCIKEFLDAGIQDKSTSISIEFNVEKRLLKEMVMKVTNIYKHEIVDTRA